MVQRQVHVVLQKPRDGVAGQGRLCQQHGQANIEQAAAERVEKPGRHHRAGTAHLPPDVGDGGDIRRQRAGANGRQYPQIGGSRSIK